MINGYKSKRKVKMSGAEVFDFFDLQRAAAPLTVFVETET
jgi:hypothetical protein